MENKKFHINQEYESTCWFTGGVTTYKVDEIKDGNISFKITRHEIDGIHYSNETYKCLYDENNNEYILLYEYKGHENRINAGFDAWGNEIY